METAENNNRMVTGADLIRRGATLLQEACSNCGGVQIRYQNKVYCLNEDDLDSVLSPKPQQNAPSKSQQALDNEKGPRKAPSSSEKSESSSQLRRMLEEKLNSVSKQLETETDVVEQGRLLELISKYLETLEKLKKAESTVTSA